MNTNEFIKELRKILDKIIQNKTLDAWFFNDADFDEEGKKEAEEVLNNILPGKWKFIEITGNSTNVGEGWFMNNQYKVSIALSSDNDDYINGYSIVIM